MSYRQESSHRPLRHRYLDEDSSNSGSWFPVIVAFLVTFALMGILPPILGERSLSERERMRRVSVTANYNQPN